jgi:hypothetical protein
VSREQVLRQIAEAAQPLNDGEVNEITLMATVGGPTLGTVAREAVSIGTTGGMFSVGRPKFYGVVLTNLRLMLLDAHAKGNHWEFSPPTSVARSEIRALGTPRGLLKKSFDIANNTNPGARIRLTFGGLGGGDAVRTAERLALALGAPPAG